MQADGEKGRKSESQQAVVQTGRLGFYPLNSLGVSALHHGQASCVIACREDSQSDMLRNKAELTVAKHKVAIGGRLFLGFSDAFYRGCLPELIIVTSDMGALPTFFETFLDFVEKLFSLGFLGPAIAEDMTLLDKYVPQIVLGSYGVVFNPVLRKLEKALGNIEGMTPRLADRLLQKFSRAVFISPEEGYDTRLSPLELFEQPLALNLAGAKSIYTVRANQLLEANGISNQFNPNGMVGVLEWELNLAYKHLLHRMIPLLEREGQETPQPAVLTAYFEQLGQGLGILPGLVTVSSGSPAKTLKTAQLGLSLTDLAMLHQLHHLAEQVQQADFCDVIADWMQRIQPLVSRNTPLAAER